MGDAPLARWNPRQSKCALTKILIIITTEIDALAMMMALDGLDVFSLAVLITCRITLPERSHPIITKLTVTPSNRPKLAVVNRRIVGATI